MENISKKIYKTTYLNISSYLNIFNILLMLVCLTACGGAGGGSNNSTPSQQSFWNVISTQANGYSPNWDMKQLEASQSFQDNFIYGIINDGGWMVGYNIPYSINNPSWSYVNTSDSYNHFSQISCYQTLCIGISLPIYNKLRLYDFTVGHFVKWYNITPSNLSTESFSAINMVSESSVYAATDSQQIYNCILSYVYESSIPSYTYKSDCQDSTYGYSGSKINAIATPDNLANSSVYLMTNEGIWQLQRSSTPRWVLMPQSPTNGTSIRTDTQGRVFVASNTGGYYYNGNNWQQVINKPQSSVTLCDRGNFSGNNEKIYFSDEFNFGNYVNVFYPSSGKFENISSYIISPDSGETFNTGIYGLTTSNNCYIYGLSQYNNKTYVVTIK